MENWPNWKNLPDYDFTENLSYEGWAWEFLRRNKVYQKDYEIVREIYSKAEKLFGNFEDNEKKWRKYKPVIVENPFTELGDFDGAWNGRMWDRNIVPKWSYREPAVAAKWGLKYDMIYPFSNKNVPIFRYPYDHPKYLTVDTEKDYFVEVPSPDPLTPESSHHIALGFDLKLPIDTQLKKAKDILKTQKKFRKIVAKKNKSISRLWRDYLRILDAELPEPSPSDKKIACHLLNIELSDKYSAENIQKVSDWRKQAETIRDKDYIKILRSDWINSN